MLPEFSRVFQSEEHQPFHWEAGSHAVLLLHGFPGTPAEMRPLAQLLHEHGWTVRAPLLPGFGPDIATLADRTHDEWIMTAEAEVLELKHRYETVLVIGNSMGGTLAMCLAGKCKIDAAILLAPFWRIEHILWRLLPLTRILFPHIKPFRITKPDFSDPKTQEGILNFMPDIDLDNPEIQHTIRELQLPIGMFNQIRQLGRHGYTTAPEIKVPALIMQGLQDDLVKPHLTRKLIQRIAGKVSYVEVDAGHNLLNTEEDSKSYIEQTILHFLQSYQVREPIL